MTFWQITLAIFLILFALANMVHGIPAILISLAALLAGVLVLVGK